MSDQPLLFLPIVLDEGLEYLKKRCASCTKCELHRKRTNAVFGEGNPTNPDVCFIGEAPGYTEDIEGRPFVGRSGQFLDRMISAMGYKREELYMLNVTACRPPDSRAPTQPECDACEEFWLGQIRAIKPKVLVTLGATAFSALKGGKKKIHELRGKWFEFNGIPLMPTLHPSQVVRAEKDLNFRDLKKMVWGDLQNVLAKLGRSTEATLKPT